MSEDIRIVIPARYASERLPGKPLADIHGLPMIVRTARSAAASGVSEVVVATDDERVAHVAKEHGVDVQMTSPDHPSGTDRLWEVVQARGWATDALVFNVQGDEPLVPAAVIRQLADGMRDSQDVHVGTLCEPVEQLEDVFNPNVVKVVRDRHRRAIYFSRAPIPFARGQFDDPAALDNLPEEVPYWRHIGIYAYRVSALERFVALGSSMLERAEALEQLRLLEAGVGILVLEACEPVPGGVDTPQDLERVRRVVAGSG